MRSEGRFVSLVLVVVLVCIAGSVWAADTVGPFLWSRELFNPDIDRSLQPERISRNGDVEEAGLVLGSTPVMGVLDTMQWSGSTMLDGKREWSANNFVAFPFRPYTLSIQDYGIYEADLVNGSYEFYPRGAQDMHLRFGYLSQDAAPLVEKHGQRFSMDEAMPCHAVVCNLTFRWLEKRTWQTGSFGSGSPQQCGIWQIPSGKVLRIAQQNKDNCLALPTFLEGTQAHDPMTFLFRMQDDGHWQLLVDFEDESKADRLVTSLDPGNKPASLPGVSESHGLVISSITAGGAPWPRVMRCPMDVGYVTDSASLKVTPPSGEYLTKQWVDVGAIIPSPNGSRPKKLRVYLDGVNVTRLFRRMTKWGVLKDEEGFSARIRSIPMRWIGRGLHTFKIEARMDDGSIVSDTVEWEVKRTRELRSGRLP